MKTSIKNSIVVLAAALTVCACIDETPSKGKVYYGAEAVDMGLSVRWASCNVGAKSPEEFGEYFNCIDSSSGSRFQYDLKLYNYPRYDEGGKKSNAEREEDYNKRRKEWDKFAEAIQFYSCADTRRVTHEQSGKYWRYPTSAEWYELFNSSVVKPKTYNGVQGLLFISCKNGNRIFLPAAGFFRKSTGKMASQGVRGYYGYSGISPSDSTVSVNTFPSDMPLDWKPLRMPFGNCVSFRLVFPNDSLLNAVEK